MDYKPSIDVRFADVTAPGWDAKQKPYSIALNGMSEIANRQPFLAVVDAKSASLTRTGIRQLARSKTEEQPSIWQLRQSFEATTTEVRPIPHARMPADT